MKQALAIVFFLAVLPFTGARADYVLDLVHAECRGSNLAMSFTNVSGYPLPGEEPYPDHLYTLDQLAKMKRFECADGEFASVAEVTNFYPAQPRGACGAKDKASMRFTLLREGEVEKEAWVEKSHGWCGETDRQARIGPNIFSICTKPNDPKRDPSLLDMTGYDCVDLLKRN